MNFALPPDEIHVWRVALDPDAGACPELGRWLGHAERERAARFVRDADRQRFVIAHGVLRLLLAEYCGCGPLELVFAAGSWGKPLLQEPAGDIRFNLSHSGEIALIAATRGADIGVDVEYRRARLAAEAIAARFFAAEEVAALRGLPAEQRTKAFFRCWTRKEAFIKARGEGLSLPLGRFVVSLAPDMPPALLSIDGSAEAAAEWTLTELPVPAGYTAALAVKATRRRLIVRDWDHSRRAQQ